MERINYFHSYKSKSPNHEDQLTRAFLVLLKYSFHSSISFFDYCRNVFLLNTSKEKFPSINELTQQEWEFATQKTNPRISSTLLLSVLITDSTLEEKQKQSVSRSDRTARYDGLISIGNEITFVIEVKPLSDNVWFDQLSPSRENLSDETTVVAQPILLQWKEIVSNLTTLLNLPTVSAQERMMIDDFLEFIDVYFPFLNPYDAFGQCKNNEILLYRRIDNLLTSISKDKSLVAYHRGWGNIIRVENEFDDIYQIGLILIYNKENSSWHLDLCLFFADTVSQARTFYLKNIRWSPFEKSGWRIKPNFHVSFRSQGLVWFDSTKIQVYIDYWKKNITQIRQYKKPEVKHFLQHLHKESIISYDASRKDLLFEKFYNTEMSKLNVCPGFGLIYKIESDDAIKMDGQKTFSDFIKSKIIEGFGLVGYSQKELRNILK